MIRDLAHPAGQRDLLKLHPDPQIRGTLDNRRTLKRIIQGQTDDSGRVAFKSGDVADRKQSLGGTRTHQQDEPQDEPRVPTPLKT